jgi:hypothetical protein
MTKAEGLRAAEAKLQKLAARLNKGWDALHPVRERHLQTVREAVRQQWEQKHGQTQGAAAQIDRPKKHRTRSATKDSRKTASQKRSKSQSHDSGHTH